MATSGGTIVAERPATLAGAGRVRLSWRAELITVLLGTWLMIGLFVDGWAHNNLTELETFFTPWHAQFYSGFVATAGWMVWQVDRARRSGRRGINAVPLGYGLGLTGAMVFAVGGVGDMVWHEIFGIETGIDALFSPTHLLLFVGLVLILSSPLRAAWSDVTEPAEPGYGRMFPVLLSVTLVTALVAFMFQFWTAIVQEATVAPLAAGGAPVPADDVVMLEGIAGILATSLILTAPLLLIARRWVPPRGTATTLFAIVALLINALIEFSMLGQLGALLLSGVAVDVGLAVLRPSATDRWRYWATGLLIPLVTWTIYFTMLAVDTAIGWPVEMWTGSIMWGGVLGLTLALLMLPPAVPAASSDPVDAASSDPADAGAHVPEATRSG